MEEWKKNKGITLIALIITIIVLLILAGITIGMLTSDNSILKQVKNTKTDQIVGEEKEKIELAYEAAAANESNSEFISEENFRNELNRIAGEGNVEVSQTDDDEFEILFTKTNNEYLRANGELTKFAPKSIKKSTSFIYSPNHSYNAINVLYRSGKFIRQKTLPNETTGYKEVTDDNAIIIAENVKDYVDDSTISELFYRNRNNELFYFDGENSTMIGLNVVEYTYYAKSINKLFFIDSNKNLYMFDKNNNITQKISENVKEYYFEKSAYNSIPVFYIDDNNNLYSHEGLLVEENVKKVYQHYVNMTEYRLLYTTQEDDVYNLQYDRARITIDGISYDRFSKSLYGKNVKEVVGSYYLDKENNLRQCIINEWNTIICSNVKKIGEYYKTNSDCFYLTANNELYIENNKIADNVKQFNYFYYINKDDELYRYNKFVNEFIADNVKEVFGDSSYLKNDGTLIYRRNGLDKEIQNVTKYYPNKVQYINNGKKKYANNDIEVIDSGDNWYQSLDGKIYYYSYNSNDIGW